LWYERSAQSRREHSYHSLILKKCNFKKSSMWACRKAMVRRTINRSCAILGQLRRAVKVTNQQKLWDQCVLVIANHICASSAPLHEGKLDITRYRSSLSRPS
jgi:hypothetical protein